MLSMAMALIMKSKFIMLDEPTGNLAPKIATEVLNKIIELREQSKLTILLVEQAARKALEVSDRAYLLVSGRVIYEGGSKELLEHPELGKLYLGVKKL
jgi:branched-chain amino acid transport system ATP-binding protein